MRRSTFCELKLSAMKRTSRIRNRSSALVVALMLCCTGLVVRAHRGLTPELPHSEALAAEPALRSRLAKPSLAQLSSTDKRGLHVIVFTLYVAGIEPAVLHTTKGLVAVSIEDHSGCTAGIVIERETGNGRVSIGQVNRDQNHWRGRTELRLEPGRYHVFDSSRPANDAELIVDP